jgi:hypothetical protein
MPSSTVKHLHDNLGRFAAHPPYYKDVSKHCGCCGKPLALRNNRDIARRNYCSLHCRSKGSARTEAFKSNATKQCGQCGADFTAKTFSQKYCSLNCCGINAMGAFRKRRAASLEGFLKALIRSNNKRNGLTTDSLLQMFDRQNGRCAISGVEMTRLSGQGHVATNISIDRIDSSKSYTPDNIQLVCHIVNLMKHNLTTAQLVDWCRKITEMAGG